jgi:hypothetical protein
LVVSKARGLIWINLNKEGSKRILRLGNHLNISLNREHRQEFFLAGQRFSSNQEAIAAVEGYFADLTKNRYRDGIMALEHRWNKCINLKGDYVEK